MAQYIRISEDILEGARAPRNQFRVAYRLLLRPDQVEPYVVHAHRPEKPGHLDQRGAVQPVDARIEGEPVLEPSGGLGLDAVFDPGDLLLEGPPAGV